VLEDFFGFGLTEPHLLAALGSSFFIYSTEWFTKHYDLYFSVRREDKVATIV
jgi:hypothetical protein